MARPLGQIAMSVLATLVASALYSGMQREIRTLGAPPPLTSGGKFAARIEGESTLAAAAGRPVLSLVDWSIGPRAPAMTVVDPGWSAPLDDAMPVPATASAATAAPSHTGGARRLLVRHLASAPAPPTPRPASLPQLELHATAALDAPSLWSTATARASRLVEDGSSLLASSGAALGRLLP